MPKFNNQKSTELDFHGSRNRNDFTLKWFTNLISLIYSQLWLLFLLATILHIMIKTSVYYFICTTSLSTEQKLELPATVSCDCELLTTTKFDFSGVEIGPVGRTTCVDVKGEVINCPGRQGRVINPEVAGAAWDASRLCRLISAIPFLVRAEITKVFFFKKLNSMLD